MFELVATELNLFLDGKIPSRSEELEARKGRRHDEEEKNLSLYHIHDDPAAPNQIAYPIDRKVSQPNARR